MLYYAIFTVCFMQWRIELNLSGRAETTMESYDWSKLV